MYFANSGSFSHGDSQCAVSQLSTSPPTLSKIFISSRIMKDASIARTACLCLEIPLESRASVFASSHHVVSRQLSVSRSESSIATRTSMDVLLATGTKGMSPCFGTGSAQHYKNTEQGICSRSLHDFDSKCASSVGRPLDSAIITDIYKANSSLWLLYSGPPCSLSLQPSRHVSLSSMPSQCRIRFPWPIQASQAVTLARHGRAVSLFLVV